MLMNDMQEGKKYEILCLSLSLHSLWDRRVFSYRCLKLAVNEVQLGSNWIDFGELGITFWVNPVTCSACQVSCLSSVLNCDGVLFLIEKYTSFPPAVP